MTKRFLTLVLLFFYFGGNPFYAQETVFEGNPDTAFEKARELAFNSKRKEAQNLLLHILTKYPDYHDIRSFLGSTYSWDGNYDEARKQFDYILKKSPDRLDTWTAAINNELWAEAPYAALEMTKKALEHIPDNQDLLYLKASAEDSIGNKEEALHTLKKVIDEGSANEKFQTYFSNLKLLMHKNRIGVRTSLDAYSDLFDPMQYYQLRYVRNTKFGSIHAKINASNRFNTIGTQLEVDLYPRIADGFYAYASFGWSDSSIYPEIRYGAELYKSLPLSLELSLGMRALKFSETTNIYTGSLGWYFGNNYLNLRTYVTPGDAGTSKSGSLTFRIYRKDADNYFTVQGGAGFSPDNYLYDFNDSQSKVITLKTQNFNLGYYLTSKNNKNAWGFNGGVSHQERSFDPGSYFWIYSMSLSWQLLY